jgi:hypothetical protein
MTIDELNVDLALNADLKWIERDIRGDGALDDIWIYEIEQEKDKEKRRLKNSRQDSKTFLANVLVSFRPQQSQSI